MRNELEQFQHPQLGLHVRCDLESVEELLKGVEEYCGPAVFDKPHVAVEQVDVDEVEELVLFEEGF